MIQVRKIVKDLRELTQFERWVLGLAGVLVAAAITRLVVQVYENTITNTVQQMQIQTNRQMGQKLEHISFQIRDVNSHVVRNGNYAKAAIDTLHMMVDTQKEAQSDLRERLDYIDKHGTRKLTAGDGRQ